MNLNKGLVGHWTMDDRDTDGDTLYDRSAYDIHMDFRDVSTVTTSSGIVENRLSFSDSYLSSLFNNEIPDYFGEKIKDSCAISFWMRDLSFTGDNAYDAWVIRSRGDNIDKSIGIFGGRDNESIVFERRDESGSFQGISTNFKSWGNEWNHVVCQFSSSDDNRELWVNGELDNTESNGFQATSDFNALDISRGGVNGELDDIRLYSRTLSSDEINALYQMRSPRTRTDDLSKGLVGHWTMDDADTSGGTLYDRSAYNNHGSVENSPSVSNDSISGEVFDFSDTSSRVEWGNNNPLDGLSDYTISGWVKGGNGGEYWLSLANNNTDNEMIWQTIQTNEWTFCAVTRESGSGTAYVNAAEDSSFLWSNKYGSNPLNVEGFVLAEEQDSVLGGYNSGQAHQGLIDEIRVYDRALTKREINRLYNKRQ